MTRAGLNTSIMLAMLEIEIFKAKTSIDNANITGDKKAALLGKVDALKGKYKVLCDINEELNNDA